ncbi:MAG: flagellar biosynthesis protein FlhA [Clostridiaceae bacterium]|nr:flagellar biosynthesis protein FlhA [Clostridiaceae bacterium]
MKATDLIVAFGVFLIIVLILVPLSPLLLDFLLIVSISLSIVVLLLTMFSHEVLDLSVFPPLLLILTLFRLSLNISSTRLILGNSGNAGAVVRTFGGFVIGGNLAVGLVIFAIIVVVQFIVITKGSERVAEVSARFTLDAMPGKQMAIDADLNAGLITEVQARARRLKIQREADFYGAMDGASKFVKGDAIVGILIVLINMIGGLAIGVVSEGKSFGEAIQIYTLATVGDGLVSQLPALLVSTATGIIVTRSASENNLGHDITSQFSAQPIVLLIAAAMVFTLGTIPGLPKFPIFLLAASLGTLGLILRRRSRAAQSAPAAEDGEIAGQGDKAENVVSLISVDPIELEIGYGLITLADPSQGGDLSDRIIMIRRQCAVDLGMVIPGIRLRDNVTLKTNGYVMKIRGDEVARGDIMPEHLLAMSPDGDNHGIIGTATTEPSFGLPALWISKSEREKAETAGFTIVDPPSVIATHLSEILRRHAHELLDRQQVQVLVEHLKETQPTLVEEVFPKLYSLGDLQKVLAGLLREAVAIRDLTTIVETMADFASVTRNSDTLVEFVRQRLKRAISRKFIPGGKARVITLDPQLEQLILERLRNTDQGSFIALAPDQIQQVMRNLQTAVEDMLSMGLTPVVLTSPAVRPHFKKMADQLAPDLAVLSYNEIEATVELQADRMVGVSA